MHFDSETYFERLLKELDEREERKHKEYEALSGLTGMTIEEYDADVTADDPGRDDG